MKVVIFSREVERRKIDTLNVLESEINDWLDKNKNVKVKTIKQSSNGGSWNDSKIIISIWYEVN